MHGIAIAHIAPVDNPLLLDLYIIVELDAFDLGVVRGVVIKGIVGNVITIVALGGIILGAVILTDGKGIDAFMIVSLADVVPVPVTAVVLVLVTAVVLVLLTAVVHVPETSVVPVEDCVDLNIGL